MEQILKAVEKFSESIGNKGYDGPFLTAAGSPDKLRNSLGRYLHDSLLGTEKGLAQPFFLTTFLEWNGEDRPSITADMKTSYREGKFEVSDLVLTCTDPYGKVLKKNELKNLTLEGLPKKKAVLELIKGPVKHKNARRRKMRFW
tara:strand:+ start:18142 stop:18573 length:432 start_codon:yes stop_codon:yes gene_type:complete